MPGPIGREATRRQVRAQGPFYTGATAEMLSGLGSSHVVLCGGSLHNFREKGIRSTAVVWRPLFVIALRDSRHIDTLYKYEYSASPDADQLKRCTDTSPSRDEAFGP